MDRSIRTLCFLLLALQLAACVLATKGNKGDKDPYAKYVWPPPPAEAKIRLTEMIRGRASVEADSKLKRALIGGSNRSRYDWLLKPFDVAYDSRGRILVTDPGVAALLRFDREGKQMDVLGTRGVLPLSIPLGVNVGKDETIYVADGGLKNVVSFDENGKLRGVYGKPGELLNPTSTALSPNESKLFVTDSKGNKVVVFDVATADMLYAFGKLGVGPGELHAPTDAMFGPDGNLFVVDQLNSRVQVFSEEGDLLDSFGSRGVGFGNFARPKGIAVDTFGFIYVTDGAFNNIQVFDYDFALLTFVGTGGRKPGQFSIPSGIAIRGDEFAVVDSLNRRVQIFRFVQPRSE